MTNASAPTLPLSQSNTYETSWGLRCISLKLIKYQLFRPLKLKGSELEKLE